MENKRKILLILLLLCLSASFCKKDNSASSSSGLSYDEAVFYFKSAKILLNTSYRFVLSAFPFLALKGDVSSCIKRNEKISFEDCRFVEIFAFSGQATTSGTVYFLENVSSYILPLGIPIFDRGKFEIELVQDGIVFHAADFDSKIFDPVHVNFSKFYLRVSLKNDSPVIAVITGQNSKWVSTDILGNVLEIFPVMRLEYIFRDEKWGLSVLADTFKASGCFSGELTAIAGELELLRDRMLQMRAACPTSGSILINGVKLEFKNGEALKFVSSGIEEYCSKIFLCGNY